MNRNSVSLASLAISVSAAALLGISGIAEGDQPGACMEGAACPVPYGEMGDLAGHCGGGGMEGCSCVAEDPINHQLIALPTTQCGAP